MGGIPFYFHLLHSPSKVTCRVENAYSGYRCPIFSFGIMTALRFPCCAEGRIKVYEGDMMAITRWQGKWVYGNKILSEGHYEVGRGLQIYVTLSSNEKCWNLSIQTLLRLVNNY